MFQYAIGRNLALKYNSELILDLKDYEKNNKHKFSLLSFPIKAQIKSTNVIKYLFLFPQIQNPLFLKTLKFFRWFLRKNVYFEKSLNFDDSVFTIKPDLYINGYFQSEKYFKNIGSIIKNEFQFEVGKSEYEKKILGISNLKNSVALHIRRGDYVNNNVHGVTSFDYFVRALIFLESKLVDALNICVFSDDANWTKNNIHFDNRFNVFFSENNKKALPHIDLMLMSKFNHQIITNSTFSWWSAWLNSNESKIVIAPKIWFLDSDLQNQSFDLIPSDWIRI
jgi:hypothetical protein